MENPMDNVKPNEVNRPSTEKSAGEGRKPERNFTIADKTAIKVSEYKDIADLFAARADNLFNKNQKRSKALGIKGFDKTSALYRQWYNTTQVVRLADKVANIYSNAEATSEDLAKAAELEQEIKDTRIALDLTREEAWDESAAAAESQKRTEGLPSPNKQSATTLINEILPGLREEAKADDADREKANEELKARWAGGEVPTRKSLQEQAAQHAAEVDTPEEDFARGLAKERQVIAESLAIEEAGKAKIAAAKNNAENAQLQKQIEIARKEADRIGAEQKRQIEDARLASLLKPGIGGWFRRLFAGKEDRARVAQVQEAAMLKKAGQDADDAMKRGWTEEDERKQQESIKAKGIWKRGLDARGHDKLEQALINRKSNALDKKYDKKVQKEKDMLAKWGAEADAAMKRGWTEEDEARQEKQLEAGAISRGLDRAENAIINAQARRMEKNLDKKLAKEQAEAAELEEWQEEIDESVARQSPIDKVLSKFERDPEKVATKKLAKMDAAEARAKAKEAAMLKKWSDQAAADMKRPLETDEQIEKRLRTGPVGRILDKAEEAIVQAQTRRLEKRLGKKIAAQEKEAAELEEWQADEVPDAEVIKVNRRKGKQPIMPADATERKDIAI